MDYKFCLEPDDYTKKENFMQLSNKSFLMIFFLIICIIIFFTYVLFFVHMYAHAYLYEYLMNVS